MTYNNLQDDGINYNSLTKEELQSTLESDMISEIFSNVGSGSINSIRECIDDINSLISSREQLHSKIVNDMDMVELEINNFLNTQKADMQKEEFILFKEKSIELSDSKRKELLDCWRDISKLKEELRKHKRELSEKESRASMLDNILSD